MPNVRDAKDRRDLVMRLKRIEGQLRGIQAMIESSEDCEKIIQQVSASRRALDKVFFNVLACAVRSDPAAEPGGKNAAADRKIRQAAELLAKFG
ncbi:MAG TPA: metal-sensitive transcriptional regulator [Usitatibacter sp.]|nr:metal-sensitive transcriptional regulator [Usitatibacter sp.]